MPGNSNVPAIRFAGFTDPWEQRKLSDMYAQNNERNASREFGYERTLSIATMTFNGGNGASDQSLDNYKVIRVGDIAFEGHTNKEHAYGRFVLNDAGDGLMSPRFSCLRPVVEQKFTFWKYYIPSEKLMRPILVNATKSGTMMNELVVSDLMRQSIPVPELAEQNDIGSLLQRLDDLITLHQRKHDKLTTLKKSMLEKMFPKEGADIPEIRFAGFTDPWEQCKLGEVAEIIGGGTPDTNNPNYWDGDIDWYSPAELGEQIYADASQRRITREGYENSSAKMLPADKTILFTSRAGIGTTAILRRSACTNQGFQSLALRDEVNVYFIYSMSDRIKAYAESKASGSTFLEISGRQLAEMDLMLPNRAEQDAIGSFFAQLDDLITLHQRQLDSLKKVKRSCLDKMFV